MHRIAVSSLLIIAAIAADTRAQGVPYDDHIVSLYRSAPAATGDGLLLASPKSGSCRAVTGLTALRGSGDVNAVQMDPANGNIWIGGYGSTAGQLDVITLDATGNVNGWQNWGQVVTTASSTINAIVFDDNGDVITASDDGIYRFSRAAPGNGVMIASTASSTSPASTICRDPAGNLYFGRTDGTLLMMGKNPDCTYGAPIVLGNVATAAGSALLAGVDYCPGPQPKLYWVVDGGTGGAGTFDLPAGPAMLVTGAGIFGHAIEFDTNDNDLSWVDHSTHVLGLTKGNATSTVCMLPGGFISTGIDTDDCADGQVTVLPACPPRGAAFTLEVSVCCPPGAIAAIFVSAPGLGVGPQLVTTSSSTAANGRVSTSFANLAILSSLPANTLVFSSGCLDVNSGTLSLGAPVAWPAN